MRRKPSDRITFEHPGLEEYEELVVRREQLFKDSLSIELAYTKEFGERIADIFKEKIECIRLKKTINYCQALINQGKKIEVDKMNAKIEGEMAGYYAELKSILAQNQRAEKADSSEDYEVKMAKKIYRRIARKLHPDINRKTQTVEELSDLWNRVMAAYHKNDVDTLEDLEVMVNKVMKDLGEEGFAMDIPDLEKRIERLERQITELITSKPYIYLDILSDEEEKKKHREKLEKELQEYKAYRESLNEILEKLLTEGGGTFTWRMT